MGADENTVEQQPLGTASSDSIDALLVAVRYDDVDDLMSIASTGVYLDSKDSEGRTVLHMASANSHLGMVEYLISNGATSMLVTWEDNAPLHWLVSMAILRLLNISFLPEPMSRPA